MIRHDCPGIRTQPLGSYLAGLGLIRLIGEQADRAAVAWWGEGGLVVETTVHDLAEWLASEYVPTPVLSPWNGGSGFGAKDREPKRRLENLLARQEPRLGPFQEATEAAGRALQAARAAGWIKPEGRGGEKITDKARIVQEFRNRCPDALLPWIDATVVLADEQALYPPLLGTGGNDGRLDFSTSFHQRLLEVLDGDPKGRERSRRWARDLLSGGQTERLGEGAVGQFDPAAAGGQGSSPFGSAVSLVNPWGYVLLTEGALLFASGQARRHQHAAGRAAIPFTVRFSPDGSESGAAGESASARGEVWVPVWRQPCTLGEIRQLFGEARAAWNGRPAQRAVDFYAATRTLGVARGIGEFVRYGLQRRNGRAFVAVPMDRIEVRDRPEVGLAARVEDWIARIRSPDASSAVGAATRRFDAAQLAYTRDSGPRALAAMLAAATSLEQAAGRSGRAKEKTPVRRPPSAAGFLPVIAEAECAELRVAAGIASCATRPAPGTAGRTMRQILMPVDPGDREHLQGRWRGAPLVPGFGLRSVRQVLADVLAWRSRTAPGEEGSERFRGVPTFRTGVVVPPDDLHALARGLLDAGELDLWLRACLGLDWHRVHPRWKRKPAQAVPVATLGLLQTLADGLAPVGADSDTLMLALQPGWASRLAAGQVAAVHAEAAALLRRAGWRAAPFVSARSPVAGISGLSIAAALVPRCQRPLSLLQDSSLAVRVREEAAGEQAVAPDENDIAAARDPAQSPELAEELS